MRKCALLWANFVAFAEISEWKHFMCLEFVLRIPVCKALGAKLQ